MENVKRLLILMLAVMLSFSHVLTTYADTVEDPEDPDNPVQLEMEEVDPASLNIKKLGEVEEEDEEDLDVDFKADDIVRVSIVLDKPSTIDAGYSTEGIATNRKAMAYRDQVKQQQRQVTKTIESKLNRTLDVKWNLTLAVNIISANIRYGDINKIKLIDGVKDVFLENRYEPSEETVSDPQTANTSSGMVGATAAWADGYTGAGSRIAIIDTGLDTTHQSVNADAFSYAISLLKTQFGKEITLMTSADVSRLKSKLNGSGGVYVNAKIPFGYNYVDNNTTINHLKDTQGEHGSHVAGIAAANRFIKQGSSYVEAAASVHAVGMAPDAQLIIMKVFGSGGGAYDSDYFAALEDAIVLGCDSANLSLGSGEPGFTFNNTYQGILNSLVSNEYNKMVVSISAGNSGAITDELETDLYIEDVSMHTGGSPGTYINSLGVAAAENIGTVGAPLVFNENQNVYYTETDSSGAKMTTITGTYTYVYIDAVGQSNDYQTVNSSISLKGKIVIVNRGEITFAEKGDNAKSYSPKALIVANNQSGNIAMSLDDYSGSFPMVSISLSDAETIKSQSAKGTAGSITYYTGTVQVTSTSQSALINARENAEITDFSSWGIPGSLIMKPEITAPGGNIYSIAGTNKTTSGGTAGGSDQYEFMSGTSMAAPHITGLAAVVAQYIRENNLSSKNSELTDKYSTRAIVQSLLMSTATPMKNDGEYLSILQQGSGLAEVHEAVTASSVIMISDDYETLTAKTGSASDGKIKVEFGDDPDRKGKYTYSFTIYNITDSDLAFNLRTDIFTQDRYTSDGDAFMSPATTSLSANVNYTWAAIGDVVVSEHDVDKDGDTDISDAQALANAISGKTDKSTLNMAAGDMDNDGEYTSYDVYLLLNWKPEGNTIADNVVPANSSRKVTVEITVTDSKINNYPNGAYIEGFTYVEYNTSDGEGVSYAHTHSIPLLGFYGSWTDPSMFDNTSYTDTLYGTEKTPYTGVSDTNYVELSYNGTNAKFSGNPYKTEDQFPENRLAVNSNTQFNRIVYSLYRSAGTTGFAISRIDDYRGDITNVLKSSVISSDVTGIYYSISEGAWKNLGKKSYSISEKPVNYGLKEGDMFRIGYYAIPEYNAMVLKDDATVADAGILSDSQFDQLLLKNTLGSGAFVGYDFVIDNTEPNITNATLSGTKLTVTASDAVNLAYVAIMSLDSQTIYYEYTPGAKTFSTTVDISAAIANAKGYIVVFAGDYACNEAAVAIKVNNNVQSDPYSVSSVTVTPVSLDLYKGNETDLSAKVLPLTASDRTVSWTSSNTSVATVDSNGHVVAVGSGSATIKATSNADSTKSATSSVTVTAVDKSLNGIIWDEEGKVFFSSFNANNLPNWAKLHNTSIDLELMNAFMRNTSTLYAGTLNMNEVSTVLYTVNRNTYAVTEYGTNYVPAFGMSRAFTRYTDYFVYGFGQYIVAGNLSPQQSDEGVFSGIPIGVLDISATSGDDIYVCGVCARSIGTTSSSFFFLDETGTIWYTTRSYRSSSNISFSKPSKLVETGISTSFLYQSIYSDGTNIYWGHQDGDISELIIININSKKIYHAGDFGDNVWPVGGIYVDGKVAPASIEDEPMEAESETQDLPSRDELLTEEFMNRFAAEVQKFRKQLSITSEESEIKTDEEMETVNEVTGSVNSMSGVRSFVRKITGSSDASGNEATVTLSEDNQTANGKFTIKYDTNVYGIPEVVFTNAATVTSYHVNQETGIITFVYASKTPIAANTAIATVKFTVPCDNNSITITTNERNERLSLNETVNTTLSGKGHTEGNTVIEDRVEPTCTTSGSYQEVVYCTQCGKELHREQKTIPATGHSWGEWTVTTAPTCTQTGVETRVCNNDPSHKETRSVAATGHSWGEWTVTKAPTCTEAGVETRVCKNDSSHKETRSIAATGHDWNNPTYVWSSDNKTVTATRTCKNNEKHVETETATVSITTKPATCTQKGEKTYTATFNNTAFTKQTKTEELPATGHSWGEWTVTKAPTCTETGIETRVCSKCGNTETKTVAALGHDPKLVEGCDPTCTEDGRKPYYVCQRCLDKFFDIECTNPVIDEAEIVISALGHNWSNWAQTKDPTCTETGIETRTCSRCGEKETRPVSALGHTAATAIRKNEVTPGCEIEGGYDMVVYCSVCGTELSREHTVIPATGHSWSQPAWDWNDDMTKATATFTCSNDSSHTETVTGNAEVESHVDPTHETDGKTVYVVSVVGPDGKKYTDRREVILPRLMYNFRFVEFSWSADFTSAEAVFRDDESGEVRNVTATVTAVTVKPTCVEPGTVTYTATVNKTSSLDSQAHEESETVTLNALGHNFGEWTVTKNPTCTDAGEKARTCSRCGFKETKEIAATGHDWGKITYTWSDDYSHATAVKPCNSDHSHDIKETVKTTSEVTLKPTCTQMGETTYTAAFTNKTFETQTVTLKNVPATGHNPAAAVRENNVEPTCEKEGGYDMVVYCLVCGEKLSSEHTVIAAIGHNWSEWTFNGANAKTHTRVCNNDPSHKETGNCQFDEGVTVGDTTTYTCIICHGTYTVTVEPPMVEGILRVAGDNRYGTAMNVTDFFMEANGIEKLNTIVIASGTNFADALAGSYLASVKNCPIMLIDEKHATEVEKYIANVMNKTGKVYILGGEKAVSSQVEKDIRKYAADVERLAGNNRYLTNIEILKETGLNSDIILIATGKDFADSLSASASGLPILLVKDSLDNDQISFLKSVKGKKILILGGEKAVSADIEKQLKQYGTVSRIAGNNRFETSVKIAEKLFDKPKAAVLAFSNEFPDGLCGGPLGQLIKGPVILTRPDKAEIAREYLKKAGISDGIVLGGETRIDDETVRKLYGLNSTSVIELYHR